MGVSSLGLAVRNTIRHRTRSAIALSAISFGLVALLLAGGFVEWVSWGLREAAIQSGLGHIQGVRSGYMDSGIANPFAYLLPEQSPELSALEALPEVKAVAPRLNFSGLISHGDATVSFIGEGVDPEREMLVSPGARVREGEGLSVGDVRSVNLGKGLAANLNVKPGDKVVLLVTSATGGINAMDARVGGVFSTDVKAHDDNAVQVPLAMARELLRVSGSHVWVIALHRTEDTNLLLDQLRAQFGSTQLQFIPWFGMYDFYNKAVALLSSQMNVVRVIIGLIIVLSISNTQIMNVLERTGEIGTMMAMGTRRVHVGRLFLSEGLLLGLTGGVLGLAIGLVLSLIISAIGIPMPPPPGRTEGYSAEIMVTWQLVWSTFALAVGTTVAASLYPAWKASGLIIVDALRHNR